MPAGQSDSELSVVADMAINLDRAAVLLGYDVIADRQAQTGPLAGRLGREERLEQLVLDLRRDARTVVSNADLDRIVEISRRHLQSGFEIWVASLPLAFGRRVEAIGE